MESNTAFRAKFPDDMRAIPTGQPYGSIQFFGQGLCFILLGKGLWKLLIEKASCRGNMRKKENGACR